MFTHPDRVGVGYDLSPLMGLARERRRLWVEFSGVADFSPCSLAMCRPSGAVWYRTSFPTASAVGYGLSSLAGLGGGYFGDFVLGASMPKSQT
jgi:hypothetical protein